MHMVFYIPAMGSHKFPCLVHLVTMKARPLVGQMVISCHLICSSLSTAKRITILWLEHQRKMFIYMSHEKARPYFLLIVYHNPFFRVKFPCTGVPWKLASKVSKLAYFTYLGDEINLLMQGLYSTSKLLNTMDISVRIFSPYLEPLRIRLYVLRKGWDPYIPILFGWDCNSQSYSIREGSGFLGNDRSRPYRSSLGTTKSAPWPMAPLPPEVGPLTDLRSSKPAPVKETKESILLPLQFCHW